MTKAESTLISQLALAGHTVIMDDGPGYLVERWGMVRWISDVDRLRDFAVRVGATKPEPCFFSEAGDRDRVQLEGRR